MCIRDRCSTWQSSCRNEGFTSIWKGSDLDHRSLPSSAIISFNNSIPKRFEHGPSNGRHFCVNCWKSSSRNKTATWSVISSFIPCDEIGHDNRSLLTFIKVSSANRHDLRAHSVRGATKKLQLDRTSKMQKMRVHNIKIVPIVNFARVSNNLFFSNVFVARSTDLHTWQMLKRKIFQR